MRRRWLRRRMVRIAARKLRGNLTVFELRGALVKAFPHRDEAWREEFIAEVCDHNYQRNLKAINAR